MLSDKLANTYQLLQGLQSSGSVDSSLLESLVQALSQDGVNVPASYYNDYHLRRQLAEETPDMSDPAVVISNLVPVIVCVICAGFASGLTQVLPNLF